MKISPKYKGKMYGYPISGKCVINGEIKIKALRDFYKTIKEEYTVFVGIAKDEPKRLARLKDNQRSLLAEFGYTENDARELCSRYGLLSPLYETQSRQGCWFCPNRKIREIAEFKMKYPELYNEWIGLYNSLCATPKICYDKDVETIKQKVDAYIENEQRQMKLVF